MATHSAILLVLCLVSVQVSWNAAEWSVGRGIADITGLVSEGTLYGYANPSQDARGIHLRQFSRAFIFDDGKKRVALVVAEISMAGQAIRTGVVEKLEELYGGLYSYDNVMLSPTHSHSTPGGYNAYYMYMLPSLGFINETYSAFVDGIVESIQLAHDDLQAATVYVDSEILLNTTDNRSPYAYDQNPEDEKAQYPHIVDKEMTVLKIGSPSTGENMGMLSFFPVHTTSMKVYNHLVSTDNKGYAAQMMERLWNFGAAPGEGAFVAAFAQTSEGDVTPNIGGNHCAQTNGVCTYENSTCPEDYDNPALCTGRGPTGNLNRGPDQFIDTQTIGNNQFQMAKMLYNRANKEVDAVVDYIHTWVNMSEQVPGAGQSDACRPSMGYSFGAGATDGPGIKPFVQAMVEGIPAIDALVNLLFSPPLWLRACQSPKPVLIPSGTLGENNWAWQPEIVPLQIFRLGEVFLIGVPAEVTTMSGRRLMKAVVQAAGQAGYTGEIKPIIMAMTNTYSSYLVTEEEYSVQRYEGASTIFGPSTLSAYQTLFTNLTQAMVQGNTVDPGSLPPDFRGYPRPALGEPRIDGLQEGQNYGDILVDADYTYVQGDVASFTFVSGNPRVNFERNRSYLAVKKQERSVWMTVYTDAHWETKYIWQSDCAGYSPPLLNVTDPLEHCATTQFSNGTVEWDIPNKQRPGTYRLEHHGFANSTDTGQVVMYHAQSQVFQVMIGSDKNSATKRQSATDAWGEEPDLLDMDTFIRMYLSGYDP